MSFFEISSKKKLSDMEVGDRINESDYASILPSGEFIQMKYIEEEDSELIEVNPGVWCIQKTPMGLQLQKASFTKDRILDSFIHTKEITDKIDCFFRNLHVYAEEGIEVPKRAMLLYGPPGTGKTSTINKVCTQYIADGKTAVVIWNTDKFEAYQIKDFFKSFKYNVERIILVVEDIGGVEIDEVRMKSDSSLLSLLDNKEKTFKIPVLILATTNFPQIFMGNLTNRPERFDDKIEVPYPDASYRVELLKFFSKKEVPESVLKDLGSSKCAKFSPAHIREIVIRSRIYEKTMEVTLQEIIKDIEHYEKAFSKQKKLGIE